MVPFRAALMKLRLTGIDNGTRHRLAGGLLVTNQLIRPDHHHLRGIVEMIRLVRIGGKILGEREFKAQQVSHGILILEVREPPSRGRNRNLALLFNVMTKTRIDPFRDRFARFRIRLRFVFGRHLSAFQHLQNQLPVFKIPFHHLTPQSMDSNIALALLRAVAGNTMLIKKRLHRLLKHHLIRPDHLRGNQSRGNHQTPNQPFHYPKNSLIGPFWSRSVSPVSIAP